VKQYESKSLFNFKSLAYKNVKQSESKPLFTNKTDRHDITEILLKVALNTINSRPLPIIESVHKHYNYNNAFVVVKI
jgi:hypothetical protein